MKNHLQFLNHASFLIRNEDFIFLCDPWMEGQAFNKGWMLLDQSTSDEDLLNTLHHEKKPVFIWYSHEHSDHFSISFIRKLKEKDIDVHFIFQETNDKRVVEYLKKQNQKISVLKNGVAFQLSANSSIKISSWRGGDSLSLIQFDKFTILNINDCIVETDKDINRINKFLKHVHAKKIDILFTQFGYANWIGNESDSNKRLKSAMNKLDRIGKQIAEINPNSAVLFASFVYFSHIENFYLNDTQNTPERVRNYLGLKEYQERIFFLKPNDSIELEPNFKDRLKNISPKAEEHWNKKFSLIKPNVEINIETPSIDRIGKEVSNYKWRVFKNFGGLFTILELMNVIKPLRIKLTDSQKVVTLSYLKKFKTDKDLNNYDLEMSSEVLCFSVTFDYGFDTTHVNGRFQVRDDNSIGKLFYFAGPQTLLKNGFGLGHPIKTVKELTRLILRNIIGLK